MKFMPTQISNAPSTRFFKLFLALLLVSSSLKAQLVVNNVGASASVMMNQLLGSGVTGFNPVMNCPAAARGFFSNGNTTNVGIDAGALLTSSDATAMIGPNISGSTSIMSNGTSGDPQLSAIASNTTFDECILEFDLIASCDTIQIAYVFGSEEYMEWVNSSFNDVFGFFISGPGIVGAQNIAVIPGTATPVTINNVNAGMNAAYYVDNTGGTTIELDGFTVPLLAKTAVQPCSTYHLKLAVADVGDQSWDSGVFLEQGGIQCATPQISVTASANISGGTNIAIEGCFDATFTFERAGNLTSALTIHYLVSGSAGNGTDYIQIPDSVVFPVGQDSAQILIQGVDDAITEGVEFIFIIVNDTVCTTFFSDTAVLVLADHPQAAFSYTPACEGLPINFTDNSFFAAGPFSSWNWNFGDGSPPTVVQNPSHSYASDGTYNVTFVVGVFTTCFDTITLPVVVQEEPNAAFTWTGGCEDQPITFTDQSTQGGSGSISGWNWNANTAGTSTNQNPFFTFPNPGTFNVQLIVNNTSGCADTLIQQVTVTGTPNVNFTAPAVCNGLNTVFTDLTTVNGSTLTNWAWNFGDGTTSGAQNTTHNYTNAGTYNVTLTVTSQEGCVGTAVQSVIVHANPVAAFTSTITCYGDTTFFTDQSTVQFGSLTNWDWNFGDGGTGNVQNPWNIYSVLGNYNVTLTVTSQFGCTGTVTLPISVTKAEDPIYINDTVCLGESYTFIVTPVGDEVIYWYYNFTDVNPFHVGTTYETGPLSNTVAYWIEGVNSEGCRSGKAGITCWVAHPGNPDLVVSARDVEIPNAIVEFSVSNPQDFTSFFWEFGDGTISELPAPVHQYNAPGWYSITLTTNNQFGCDQTLYYNEYINVTDMVRIYAPNVFSPNGDGLNDEFFINNLLVTDLSIQIFDRWGKLVFASDNLNFSWEGKDPNGVDMPEGAYAYKIVAQDYLGRPLDMAGTVIIMR
jgi:gliding motility-associated-like protein